MRQAFLAQTADALKDELNRPTGRTRSAMVQLSDAVFQATQSTDDPHTCYLDVDWPFENGWTLRFARLIPKATRTQVSGAVYGKAVVGVKRGSKFDALGIEYDTRTKAVVDGIPVDLVVSETRIYPGSGVVVRCVQAGGTASPALLTASVECFFGFEGG